MKIKPNQQEFVGKEVKVTKSDNKQLVGIQGTILDETKNLFIIKTKTKIVKVLKNICTFQIDKVEINGKKITKKPEERIKIKD